MKWNHEQVHNWRLLDGSAFPLGGKALFPFAVDELECREVGKGAQPLIHIWRHEKAFILGLRDRRLHNANAAMDVLIDQGYEVAVRNSGGAAVPLDPGVLNISLILPNPTRTTNLNDDFTIMAELISATIQALTGSNKVSVGEISGAYCPGAFDLAIDGRKFCGIAQRRQTGAYIVQAFIVIEGSGAKRARQVADFYRAAAGDHDKGYPNVVEHSTASVEECYLASPAAGSISVTQFVQKMKEVIWGGLAPQQLTYNYDEYDKEALSQLIKQMDNRYNVD